MKCPILDLEASSHSARLVERIRSEMNPEGFISFARFMELALYAPGLGYYSAGQFKLGKLGDFLTAPELSPLFALALSIQFQQILHTLGGGDILEIGAGSGVFAKDVLLELEKLNSLPNVYYILEVSAELRERQKKTLNAHCPHLMDRIHWLDHLIEIEGILFANEVMDSLPVHCFRIENQEIKERSVRWEHGFQWVLTEPHETLKNNLAHFYFPEKYESEINLLLPAWVRTVTTCLKKGVALLIDYGYGREEYYHPDRKIGTLMCYYQHRRHENPFVLVGLQDITAHVDFTTVIENAYDVGCTLGGYTTQAGFLLSLGLLDHIHCNERPEITLTKSQIIKMLTLPHEMGESIKVMALNKNVTLGLKGFRLQDRQRNL